MKPIFCILIAPTILLSACQTVPTTDSAQSSGTNYKAQGTEPFWSLNIVGDELVFEGPGIGRVIASKVETRPSFNGWRYLSRNLTADVTFSHCNDGMSDRTYKDSVTVKVGKKEYKGCGGGIIAPLTLEGTSWRFASVNGAQTPVERDAVIRFEAGKMSGGIGCNQLNAEYRFENKALSVGPVRATRMACNDAAGAQENALVSLLASAFTTSFPGDGSMVLSGADGSRIVLMQLI